MVCGWSGESDHAARGADRLAEISAPTLVISGAEDQVTPREAGEQLARGIPGFIVREFPVVDYVTLNEDSFPIIGTDRAIDLVAELATPEGYRALIEQQLEDHRDELGI